MLENFDTYDHYESKSERDNKLAGFFTLVAFAGGLIGVFALVSYLLG
ncbi:MAG: hypothetical protein AAGA85_07800 [Bacteroidota bacterium]